MRRQVLSILALISVLWNGAVAVAADEATDAETRVLHFPDDRAVGIVYRRPARQGSYLHTMYVDWEKIGDARGDVSVPRRDDVRLDVSQAASGDLGFLDQLQPDDVQRSSTRSTTCGGCERPGWRTR